MNIALACDHGGFPLKQTAADTLKTLGHTVIDLGAYSVADDDDYPDYAFAVGRAIQQGTAGRGIVLCGSGVGAAGGMGRLVTDLILDRPPSVDAELFKPDRFGRVDPAQAEFRAKCAVARAGKSRGHKEVQ